MRHFLLIISFLFVTGCSITGQSGTAAVLLNPTDDQYIEAAKKTIEEAQESGEIETANFKAAQDVLARDARLDELVKELREESITAQQNIYSLYDTQNLFRTYNSEYSAWKNDLLQRLESNERATEEVETVFLKPRDEGDYPMPEHALIHHIGRMKTTVENKLQPRAESICGKQKSEDACPPEGGN